MKQQNLRMIKHGLFLCAAYAMCGLLLSAALADDLEKSGMPTFFGEDDDGYGLVIYEYDARTEASFKNKREIEHEIKFLGYLRPSKADDVIGFRTRLQPIKALNKKGEDVFAGEGKGRRDLHSAVIPNSEISDRKGKPIEMAYVELSQCELDQPGANVESLELHALAVVGKKRASKEFSAVVADQFIDVGHNVSIQVTAMEIKTQGLMTVKLDVKRAGGKREAIVDSLYALNHDGDVIGGGRWINQLDIFDKDCEYEMLLLLDDEVTITNFRVVLATQYEIVEVPIVVEKLYQ